MGDSLYSTPYCHLYHILGFLNELISYCKNAHPHLSMLLYYIHYFDVLEHPHKLSLLKGYLSKDVIVLVNDSKKLIFHGNRID